MNRKSVVPVVAVLLIFVLLIAIIVAVAYDRGTPWQPNPPSPNDRFTVTIEGTLGSSVTLHGIAPDLTITNVKYEKQGWLSFIDLDYDNLFLWDRTFEISLTINGKFIKSSTISKDIRGVKAWDFKVTNVPRGTYEVVVQARNIDNGLTDTKSYTLVIE